MLPAIREIREWKSGLKVSIYSILTVLASGILMQHQGSLPDFKDAATPRFDHSDVVFDLFVERRFFAFIHPLIQFFKTFEGITGPK